MTGSSPRHPRALALLFAAFGGLSVAGAQLPGDLDVTYGDPLAPGRQTRYFDYSATGYDFALGVAIDPAGRALVVGLVPTADASFPNAIGIARFTAGGEPDGAFGNAPTRPGTLLLDLASSQELPGRTLLAEADGRVVVAGTRVFPTAASSVGIFSRLPADGSSIGSPVAFTLPSTPVSFAPRVRGFARDVEGRFLAFGDLLTAGLPFVARLTSAFAIDPSYAGIGWTPIDPFESGESGTASVKQLVIDRQGRALALVAGSLSGGLDLTTIVRLLPGGTVDASFGVDGTRRVVPGDLLCPVFATCRWELRDLALAPDGTVFAAGWYVESSAIPPISSGWLVKLDPDGTILQQAFVLPHLGTSLTLSALTLDARGALIAVGGTSSPPSPDGGMFAARYDPATLTIDPNFGLGGAQEFDFVGLPLFTLPQAGATAVALDGGRPLLAGGAISGTAGINLDFAVARLWLDAIFLDSFETGALDRWSSATGAP